MRIAIALPLLLLAALCGCSKSQPPAGKAVAVDQVCNEADGSRVRLTGYLRYRRGLMSFCSTFGGHKTCDLELYRDSAKPPDYDIMHPATGPAPVTAKLSVPVGKRPGEMDDLPEKFSESDIKLHLPNDALAPEGGRVTIDGKLSVIPGDPKQPSAPKSCFVNVEWASP
ncbi:MAG TPA: hypothetical protein VHB79_27065 [Polyangiaceae bacterium]|nr:hypothetical protein [Polyangiaceae bacterium]